MFTKVFRKEATLPIILSQLDDVTINAFTITTDNPFVPWPRVIAQMMLI